VTNPNVWLAAQWTVTDNYSGPGSTWRTGNNLTCLGGDAVTEHNTSFAEPQRQSCTLRATSASHTVGQAGHGTATLKIPRGRCPSMLDAPLGNRKTPSRILRREP